MLGKTTSIFIKTIVFVIALAVIGLPIIHLWQFFLLLLVLLAVVCSKAHFPKAIAESRRGLAKFSGYFLLLSVVLVFVPRVHIQEGSNLYFPPLSKNQPTYKQLPNTVNRQLKRLFFKYYPNTQKLIAKRKLAWYSRAHRNNATFAFSTESLWEDAKYTRVVSGIDFHSLASFNPPFINNSIQPLGQYNWSAMTKEDTIWRKRVPFFVYYSIPVIAGSDLCWKGHIMMKSDGRFMLLHHSELLCQPLMFSKNKPIEIYGLSFPEHDNLVMKFKPGWPQIVCSWFVKVLQLMLVCMIIYIYNPRLRRFFFSSLSILFLSSVVGAISFFNADLFSAVFYNIPYPAGNDGLTYKGAAHWMDYMFMHGNIVQALSGAQPVFYDMPGLRYLRSIEGLFFGETNFGSLLLLIALFIQIYNVMYRLIQKIGRTIGWYVFVMLAYGGQFIRWSFKGYSVALAALLVFSGFHYLYKSKNKLANVFVANIFFSLSFFVRPNLAIAAFLVVLFVYFNLLKEGVPLWKILLTATSLVFAFIPLAHNLYYGHKFFLITSSGFVKGNYVLTPTMYLTTLKDLLHFTISPTVSAVFTHLWHGFNMQIKPVVGATIIGVFNILMLYLFFGVFIKEKSYDIRALCFFTLGAWLPNLMWEADLRHSFFAWFLMYIIVGVYFMREDEEVSEA